MRVLVACAFSGVLEDELRSKGHEVVSCDLLPNERKGMHYQGDVLDLIGKIVPWIYRDFDLMIAFPPCTDLAVSGARFFERKRKDGSQQKSVNLFMSLASAYIPKIAIENPIGIMSTLWRKPDQIIQPYWFGDAYKKSTCLWLKNLPILKPTKMVEPQFLTYNSKKTKSGKSQYSHFGKLGKGKGKERSIIPQGMAVAMADQWG